MRVVSCLLGVLLTVPPASVLADGSDSCDNEANWLGNADRNQDLSCNEGQRDAEKRDERKELSTAKYFKSEFEIAAHHATCRPSKSRTMRSVRFAKRSSCVTITTVVFSF